MPEIADIEVGSKGGMRDDAIVRWRYKLDSYLVLRRALEIGTAPFDIEVQLDIKSKRID